MGLILGAALAFIGVCYSFASNMDAAWAHFIAANIWFAADIYRGKRGGTQAEGEKRWGAP